MREAVDLVADGRAPAMPQSEVGATYDPMMNKDSLTKLDVMQPAMKMHNFIRGLDSVPGAWITLDGRQTRVFGSKMWHGAKPRGTEVAIEGATAPGVVHSEGLLISGSDGRHVNVKLLSVEGKFVQAEKYGQSGTEKVVLELSDAELKLREELRAVWNSILKTDTADDTDFFGAGAGSMNVVQLVEEVKEKAGVTMENEDVFLNTTFGDFMTAVILLTRSGGGSGGAKREIDYDAVTVHANKMNLKFPRQLYIDGEFVNATSGKVLKTVNPHDESLICEVECGSKEVKPTIRVNELQ